MHKSILITGCSSGIGLCVARGLKARGYTVFATARKSQDVDRLRQEGLMSFPLDLSDSVSIKSAFNQVLAENGGTLYALFNNGGYGQGGAVEDLPREALREQFETNVFGWQELTNLALPVMRRQGYGRIIQNSSILGFITLKYRGAYNASKHAIEGLSDTMRLELRGTNIYVSLIEPGPIVSKFRDNGYPKFMQHIDADNSPHREYYLLWKQRYETPGPVQPFTLPPEAVLKRVIHALESRKPKARYPVTFPTYLFACLKRILPTGALDALLQKVR
jgi:NAD(P)-dependent dehydrogenase (short-subunit alcohol dehydrogenase family)